MNDILIVISIGIIVASLVYPVLRDMFGSVKGIGEQTVESDERIERENEMLMSRMIDYSENSSNG